MSFFDDLLGRAGSAIGGAAAGSALGPIGGVVGGVLGAIGGGGGGGSSSSQGAGADFYAQYGAQAAAANLPVTLAATRYSGELGAYLGALGLYGSGQDRANQNILTGAINRAQLADQVRGNEILEATRGKFDNQQQHFLNLLCLLPWLDNQQQCCHLLC